MCRDMRSSFLIKFQLIYKIQAKQSVITFCNYLFLVKVVLLRMRLKVSFVELHTSQDVTSFLIALFSNEILSFTETSRLLPYYV